MEKQLEKIVYFVRHGESEANISKTSKEGVVFKLNSSLTTKGKKQAVSIAERIGKLSFESLIVSPLARAKETAETIAKSTGKKPEYSDIFVERIKPARLDGKSRDDNETNVLWKDWQKSLVTPGLRVEDGENFDDLIARADKALDFLKNRPEKNIVVVTHGYFLRTIIIRVVLGNTLTPENFFNFHARAHTENTGLTVIKYGQTWEEIAWQLSIYNDHAHLG